MPDLLVPLYKLPAHNDLTQRLATDGIIIRRAFPFDLSRTRRFIAETFSESWADETEAGFARQPITCWIAVVNGEVKGFACVDATMRGMFGPTGVCPSLRGKGVGKALLLHALSGLWDMVTPMALSPAQVPLSSIARPAVPSRFRTASLASTSIC